MGYALACVLLCQCTAAYGNRLEHEDELSAADLHQRQHETDTEFIASIDEHRGLDGSVATKSSTPRPTPRPTASPARRNRETQAKYRVYLCYKGRGTCANHSPGEDATTSQLKNNITWTRECPPGHSITSVHYSTHVTKDMQWKIKCSPTLGGTLGDCKWEDQAVHTTGSTIGRKDKVITGIQGFRNFSMGIFTKAKTCMMVGVAANFTSHVPMKTTSVLDNVAEWTGKPRDFLSTITSRPIKGKTYRHYEFGLSAFCAC